MKVFSYLFESKYSLFVSRTFGDEYYRAWLRFTLQLRSKIWSHVPCPGYLMEYSPGPNLILSRILSLPPHYGILSRPSHQEYSPGPHLILCRILSWPPLLTPSVCPSVCPSVRPSICLSVRLSVRPSGKITFGPEGL